MAIRAVGTTLTNPAVGCIIVKNNNIISRGWTQPGGSPHAEVHALSFIKDKSILRHLANLLKPFTVKTNIDSEIKKNLESCLTDILD